MRLTLRTMLAYLDDVLDPADAVELGKKIEESKFASELVHRIRTSVRRLRLDAPKLDGKGMGLDPNTVAEYLDSTLPADRVPDFEKVCVESDRHLAEVASCHQILTLVLGGPAQVEPALRDRIYAIPAAVDESAEDAAAKLSEKNGAKHSKHGTEPTPPPVSTSATTADVAEKPTRAQPEIPDYLRVTSRSRVGPIMTTVALAFLLVVVLLRSLGPFDRTHPIAGWLGVSPVQVADNSNAENPNTGTPDGSTNVAATPKDDAKIKTKKPLASDGTVSPADRGDDEADKEMDKPLPPNGDLEPNANDKRPPVVPGDEPPDEPAPPQPNEPAPAEVRPKGTNGKETPNDASKVGAARKDKPATELKPIEPGEVDVGRFMTGEQVVAHVEAKSGLWRRLPRGTTLVAGDQLIVLPIYRPIVSLSTGVQLMFVGESLVKFQNPDTMDVPHVAIDYGRAVINTASRPGAQVRLQLGDQDGIATFGEADAEMAVEVRKYLPPGSDPETTPALTIVQMFATTGHIDWQPIGGEPEQIAMGFARVSLTGQPTTITKADALPSWPEPTKSANQIDRVAAQELEGFLVGDKPLPLLLVERMNYRKVEIRSLAARCLAAMGEYESLLGELNDERQSSYWLRAVETLHEALAHSPEIAERIRSTIELKRGPDAKILYRLLWDYSPEQLEKGGAKELVGYLEHNSLDVRVLAFETLRRITDSNHNYRPEVSADRRRIPVKIWQDRWKEGKIVYKNPPAPIPERKSAAKPAKEAASKDSLPEPK